MKLSIDGSLVTVPQHTSVLEAAAAAGVQIPTLCRHEDLAPKGACGMCIVKIDGQAGFKRACVTEVENDMTVWTRTAEIRQIRRSLLELVLSAHPADCLQCIKHGKCELQELAERLEVRDLRFDKYTRGLPVDRTSETIVAPAAGTHMGDSVCVNCGQCVVYCPVGALYEKELIDDVWEAIDDPEKIVVSQVAPAVRVAIGEEFGMSPGELSVGRLYSALRALGVDTVFDTNFSADLTIMEEGTELLERMKSGGPFPLITSCSPGWIKFGETFFPDLLENVSSCKSPQQMMGSLIKTHYAQSRKIDPSRVVSLSIMPCTAKKYESARPEMNSSGYRDVDYVLTTRELARMIRQVGIDFNSLPESEPDPVMSSYTGAATIFGASGGVMEAALRTAYEIATGTTLEQVEFADVRGMSGTKESTVDVGGTAVRVAITNGLGNARRMLERIEADKRAGRASYHFVEIMACAGGCVGGGGQPIENTLAKREQRSAGLYREDRGLPRRKSHENPEVNALYSDFLEKPGSEVAHTLLHTHYARREAYPGLR